MNIEKLKNDIITITAELKELKARYRESGQPRVGFLFPDGTLTKEWRPRPSSTTPSGWESPKDHTAWRLATLKARASQLYALRAHQRGRIHRKGMDLAAQAKYTEETAPQYA